MSSQKNRKTGLGTVKSGSNALFSKNDISPQPIKSNVVGGSPHGTAKPHKPSQKYEEAIKFLSNETMTQAIDLLLSDRDYEETSPDKEGNNDTDGTPLSQSLTDAQKLEKIHQKCLRAVSIIEKEAPLILSAPKVPRPASLMQSRAQALPLLKPKITSASNFSAMASKKTTLPNRGMLRGTTILPNKGKILKRPHSSNHPIAGVASLPDTKRQRRNSLGSSSIGSQESNGSSIQHNAQQKQPPPSVRDFLAKLNKGPTSTTQQKPEQSPANMAIEEKESIESGESSSSGDEGEEEIIESEEEDVSMGEAKESRKTPPRNARRDTSSPTSRPTRTQPSRGSRK